VTALGSKRTVPFSVKVLLCILMCALAGLCAALLLEPQQLSSLLKWVLGIFAFLWSVLLGFMAKVSDITDVPGITYQQHQELDRVVQQKLSRLWALARTNILAATSLLIPTMLLEKGIAIAPWIAVVIGGLVGVAVSCILLYEIWLEDLRSFRSGLKQKEREEKAKDALLKKLEQAEERPLAPPKGQDLSGYNKPIP
jgi:hypothetical protein